MSGGVLCRGGCTLEPGTVHDVGCARFLLWWEEHRQKEKEPRYQYLTIHSADLTQEKLDEVGEFGWRLVAGMEGVLYFVKGRE